MHYNTHNKKPQVARYLLGIMCFDLTRIHKLNCYLNLVGFRLLCLTRKFYVAMKCKSRIEIVGGKSIYVEKCTNPYSDTQQNFQFFGGIVINVHAI